MGFSFDYLLQGLFIALTWQNLFWAALGCFIGTLVGVLPGIGPVSGIAILLPMTTVLPPTSAIIMMAAIYYGAMYGGSTTAIVVNIPGEASSVPTAIEGYELAKQGKAGPALAIAAIASFVAGTLSVIALTFFAPTLAEFAVALRSVGVFRTDVHGTESGDQPFGPRPPERDDLHGPGAHGRPDRSGPAHRGGAADIRIRHADGGVDFIAIIVGLFAISEVMINVEQRLTAISKMEVKSWMPTWADIKAVHRGNASLHRGRILPGASARMRPVGDHFCGLRSGKEGLERSRTVRQGGDGGRCRYGRGRTMRPPLPGSCRCSPSGFPRRPRWRSFWAG